MVIIRSFNVNRQHTPISELQGAVVGGTVRQGVLKTGDRIKILPGIFDLNKDSKETKWKYQPLYSQVLSINTETNDLTYATPGGLIGVKLTLDPSLATKDGLIGQTMVGSDYDDYRVLEKLYVLLEIIEDRKDIKLEKDLILVINHNACKVKGRIVKIKKNKAEIDLLDNPICCKEGEYITISYPKDPRNASNVVLLGRAQIADGLDCSTMST